MKQHSTRFPVKRHGLMSSHIALHCLPQMEDYSRSLIEVGACIVSLDLAEAQQVGCWQLSPKRMVLSDMQGLYLTIRRERP